MQIPRFPFVLVDTTADEADLLAAELFALGAEGVEERDHTTLVKARREGHVTLSASFAEREEADAACAAIAEHPAAIAPEVTEVIGDAWRDAWKEHFRPFLLSTGAERAIGVRPPWIDEATAAESHAGAKWLELEPGRAFGTGLHETTQLVAAALGKLPVQGEEVLDVGTGSGILALLALALGASHVRGIDNDPEAIEVAHENASRNGLESRCTFSTDDISVERTGWKLVLANIETHILVPMAPALTRVLAPSGVLLLSGILGAQSDRILAAYEPLGLRHVETVARGEWVLMHFAAGAP